MTIISTTVGKNPLEEMEYPYSQQEFEKQYLGAISKNDRMIFVHFQGKPFNVTIIHDYVPTTNAEEAKVDWFCEDLQDLLEIIQKKKKMSFSSYRTGMQE